MDTQSIRTELLEVLAEQKFSHGYIAGVVYIGHLVEGEDGEEVELVEAVPCRRCSDSRQAPLEYRQRMPTQARGPPGGRRSPSG